MILYLLSQSSDLSKHIMGILSITWKSPILLTDLGYIERITHKDLPVFILTGDFRNSESILFIRKLFPESVIISYLDKVSFSSRKTNYNFSQKYGGGTSHSTEGGISEKFFLKTDQSQPIPNPDFEIDDIHIQDRNIHLLIQSVQSRMEALDYKSKVQVLKSNQSEWESVFRDSLDIMFIIDAHTKTIVQSNQTASIVLGYSEDEFFGMDFFQLSLPEESLSENGSGDESADFHGAAISNQGLVTKDKKWIPMESTLRLFVNDGITHIIATFRDISERKQSEKKINQLAYYDTVTNLPNKIFFTNRLKDTILESKKDNRRFAVISIDIDHFKLINETLGSDVGNRIIKRVGDRIDEFHDKKKFLAHFGGDDYALIVEGLETLEELEYFIYRLQTYLKKTVLVDGKEFYLTYTMGVAMFPFHGETSQELTKASDMAMYRSKDKGRNSFTVFSKDMVREVEKRMEMENDLRKAIQNHEFLLFFQPQVSTFDFSLCGMEALIRWNHPIKGLISPTEFIHIAEVTGLIHEIGNYVLKEACTIAKAWIDSGIIHFPVSVNMSAMQWRSNQIHDEILKIIQDTGLSCDFVNLELTESSIMEDPEASLSMFHSLIEKGVGFSVDDFGTGYSSLSYLKKLSIHHLKIDRSFIQDIATNPNDLSIARAIIQLAHSLKLKVVAEGVENKDQYEVLLGLGCDQIQGYFISKPLAEKEFEDFLKSFRKSNYEVVI